MSADLLRKLRNTIHEGSLAVCAIPTCPEISLNLLTPNYPRGKIRKATFGINFSAHHHRYEGDKSGQYRK